MAISGHQRFGVYQQPVVRTAHVTTFDHISASAVVGVVLVVWVAIAQTVDSHALVPTAAVMVMAVILVVVLVICVCRPFLHGDHAFPSTATRQEDLYRRVVGDPFDVPGIEPPTRVDHVASFEGDLHDHVVLEGFSCTPVDLGRPSRVFLF